MRISIRGFGKIINFSRQYIALRTNAGFYCRTCEKIDMIGWRGLPLVEKSGIVEAALSFLLVSEITLFPWSNWHLLVSGHSK